jgi:hypothetical protein
MSCGSPLRLFDNGEDVVRGVGDANDVFSAFWSFVIGHLSFVIRPLLVVRFKNWDK